MQFCLRWYVNPPNAGSVFDTDGSAVLLDWLGRAHCDR
jgi:hypothetical protein